MDSSGNPINAVTVSRGYRGHRHNIKQLPVTSGHVLVPEYVSNHYQTKEQMRAAEQKRAAEKRRAAGRNS